MRGQTDGGSINRGHGDSRALPYRHGSRTADCPGSSGDRDSAGCIREGFDQAGAADADLAGNRTGPGYIAHATGGSVVEGPGRGHLLRVADLQIRIRWRDRDAAQRRLHEKAAAPRQPRNQHYRENGQQQRIPPGTRDHNEPSIPLCKRLASGVLPIVAEGIFTLFTPKDMNQNTLPT